MSASIASDGDTNHSPLENLSFRGTSDEDVTVFLRDIKRVARSQGHQGDEKWMVDYLEESLSGPALLWFTKLDRNVAVDWQALRVAILAQYATNIAAPDHQVPEPPALAQPAGEDNARSGRDAIPSITPIVPYPARDSDLGPYLPKDFEDEIHVSTFRSLLRF